jgi:CO/xanthine dehydrogenase Mo-binding subunit
LGGIRGSPKNLPGLKPGPSGSGGDILTGRGIAYAFRSQTVVAEIAEVQVNRRTGRIWVKRLVCAHDCGLVVNPEALRRTVECGLLHLLSRTLQRRGPVRSRESDRGLHLRQRSRTPTCRSRSTW